MTNMPVFGMSRLRFDTAVTSPLAFQNDVLYILVRLRMEMAVFVGMGSIG